MRNQSEWGAKLALIFYFVLIGGLFLVGQAVGLVLSGMGTGDLPFPTGLVSFPVADVTILGTTLLFARYKGAGLKELGLKKISLKILVIVIIAAVFARVLAIGISIGEEAILGHNPMAEALKSLMPKDGLQLVAMIAISLVMVGPCEELAFRGFIQKGFETSFGNTNGLLIASLLFTVIHGFNYTLVYVFPVALVFGYVWQQTSGNTSASALVHGIHNSIGIALTYFTII